MVTTLHNRTSRDTFMKLVHYASIIALLLMLIPVRASAASLSSRSLALGTSVGNTATSWTFTFTPSVTTALNGITFQVCDAASGTCNVPGSWSNAGSSFSSLTYNGSSQAGWALDNTAGYLRIKNNTSVASATGPIVATFASVTNPNTTNATFYVRVLTYTGDDYTGQLDDGVVAASTSQQLTVTASVDETLVFCVGQTGVTTSSCSGATGSTVALGTLSSGATGSQTSQMGVGTNASSGYSVTVSGNTLTCSACAGSPTITALASQTASSTGTEQFGINLRANATPSVGADPDGSGTATPDTNYNTADQYRFVSGDTVAGKGGSDKFRRFTTSYIANIDTATQAGAYSTNLTYTATTTF